MFIFLKLIQKGLASHPQHELYKKQMTGFGGMMSVYIKGNYDETQEFLKALKVCRQQQSVIQ